MSLEKMSAAVVKIHTATGSGSGFYIKSKNLIVTNFHVVAGSPKTGIKTQDHQDFTAKTAMVNPKNDIAFLIPDKLLPLPEITLPTMDSTKVQDKVSILGFPMGMPFTITEGVISSTRQVLNGQPYIQTDAAINPGNSGGPMVNSKGEIIGISTAKLTEAENMGFALPISLVLEELENFQESQAGTIVKCPKCSQQLLEKTDFCGNCGAKLEVEELFPEEVLSPFAIVIEAALSKIGIEPAIARNGPNFWEFYQGSALIRWFIYNDFYFISTSPLAKLPKTNLEAVYRYILEDKVLPYALSISGDTVYLSYRVAMSDIQGSYQETVQKYLAGMALKADELDNYLIDNFQCLPIPKGEA